MRLALGISYNGQAYQGWQSQLSGQTVQDKLELALARFTVQKVSTLCAGRTDAGVHALAQVVHFDTALVRAASSWVRGTNTFLPRECLVAPLCLHFVGITGSPECGYGPCRLGFSVS